jgi:phytoene dehydrogenase-like protein
MPMTDRLDAVVVGSGPNGLAAAIRLAESGRSVLVLESADEIGGGTRSAELTRPGYVHDICSAIHPLAAGSPYLTSLPLAAHGLEWVHPDAPLAHPLDDGPAVVLERSQAETDAHLDSPDRGAWSQFIGSHVAAWDEICAQVLGPMLRVPRRPLRLVHFGLAALRSAEGLSQSAFSGPRGRALFAGLAAHSFLSLRHPTSASFGLMLGAAAHTVGWPMAAGGSQAIADALAAHLRSLGGEIRTGVHVRRLHDVPPARVLLFDLTPAQVLGIAGDLVPTFTRRRLSRFRRGPGVFKIDYALSRPVPWKAEGASRAGTVHLGGTSEEIAASEDAVTSGHHPDRPYVLVAQQSLFDRSRAPGDGQTLWAYCHVPNGSTVDMTDAIERQLERFAPGFRDVVVARSAMTSADLEAHNANYAGGDISGGAHDGLQLLARPMISLSPYRLARPDGARPGLYICSASTPPGGGVHGMCGYHAAQAVLRQATKRHAR